MNIFKHIAFLWSKYKREVLEKKYDQARSDFRNAYRSAQVLAVSVAEITALENLNQKVNHDINYSGRTLVLVGRIREATKEVELIRASFRNGLPIVSLADLCSINSQPHITNLSYTNSSC